MPGWERLLTTDDPATRRVIRYVLEHAIADADKRAGALEYTIQRGVARAFSN